MEKDNRDGSEVISVASADSRIIGESERVEVESRGDSGDTRRTRSDRGRRVKLRRRKQRDGESRDSDESTESRADESTNESSESAEKNTVRVEQYFANETNKSKNRKSDRKTASKSVNLDVVVAQVVETTFNVVAMLTNEQHWALDASERDLLSDAVVSYIEAQEKKSLQKIKKIASKYFPALNLAVVSFAIIYPRVLQSQTINKIFTK